MKKFTIALAATVMMTSPAMAGDIAKGKEKSMVCGACHGQTGISPNPMWPNLAGQKEVYLLKQLKDFKSGARKDLTMSGQAALLTEEEMANLAAYYASLK